MRKEHLGIRRTGIPQRGGENARSDESSRADLRPDRRQGRPAEAADELAPLLADPKTATPAVQSHRGFLAHRPPVSRSRRCRCCATPWRRCRTICRRWRRWWRYGASYGLEDDARETLDAALATTTDAPSCGRRAWRSNRWADAARAAARALGCAMPQSTRGPAASAAGAAAGRDRSAPKPLAARLLRTGARLIGRCAVSICSTTCWRKDPQAAIEQSETWIASPRNRPTCVSCSECWASVTIMGACGQSSGNLVELQQRTGAVARTFAAAERRLKEWPELAERPRNAPTVACSYWVRRVRRSNAWRQ